MEKKDEMIKAIEEQAGKSIQKFNDAKKRSEDLKSKKAENIERLESLKSEIKQPFENENIEAAVKNRRHLQAQIEESEDIIKNIETFLLDSQEKLQFAGNNLSGFLLSVVNSSHTNHQKKMDQLFDTINLMHEDFSKAIIDALSHFLGADIHNYISSEQFKIWRQIDFSHAPKDNSQSLAVSGLLLGTKP